MATRGQGLFDSVMDLIVLPFVLITGAVSTLKWLKK
jgi:hypothetical protein